MTTPTPSPGLSEKDFIQEGFKKDPFPFWVWFFLLTAFVSLLWGGASIYYSKLNQLISRSPFLQVTNRELSLFLWQNSEFMRVNVSEKNNYLPGFHYLNKVTLELPNADVYVVAPPELLFRYHTWHRLISNEFSPRAIPKGEFQEFLNEVEEWQPQHWPHATKPYKEMIAQLPESKWTNLEILSKDALPQEVRLAFQGWKNYFKEGEAINHLKATFEEVSQFIQKNPHYARNFWRNIVSQTTPDYLKTFTFDQFEPQAKISKNELAPFLKVALYNFIMAKKEFSEESL